MFKVPDFLWPSTSHIFMTIYVYVPLRECEFLNSAMYSFIILFVFIKEQIFIFVS